MYGWVRYNNIIKNAEKGDVVVNLDAVLEKLGKGVGISLEATCPNSVTVETDKRFYIKPTVKDIECPRDSKIMLFSAPGATGKSALAHYISHSRQALLWDLAKEKIANHSLSGMLVEALGTSYFSTFTTGLKDGSAVLVIDALDEAEMISGRLALETLLADLRQLVKDSSSCNVVLCARTETAHFVREYYAQSENKLSVSQYEISFFEETNAVEFVKGCIDGKQKNSEIADAWIQAQFEQIRQMLEGEKEEFGAFVGYAPVLEALAVFFVSERNGMKRLRETQVMSSGIAVFNKIVEKILQREHDKVVAGFKERCGKDYPEFDKWDNVYSAEEQLARIADYLIFESCEYQNYELDFLPQELAIEYGESIGSFLKDHPFVRTTERNGCVYVDFAGAAFRDYTLAKLMEREKYDSYAEHYFSEHNHNARFPSQLFFEFYALFSAGKMKATHFIYLYDAFKAKEKADVMSAVVIEEVDDAIYCTFTCESGRKRETSKAYEFIIGKTDSLCIKQIYNGYVDIDEDVVIGMKDEDAIISNSTIKCKRILLNSPCIMLVGQKPSGTLLVATEGIDNSLQPGAKFEIRLEDADSLKVSAPDVSRWYKLQPYEYSIDDGTSPDMLGFGNAVKTILKHFRKHGKDAPGRHFEYITNVIISGSKLKKQVFDFLSEQECIYKDDKDIKQFKLDTNKLQGMGVNWGQIERSARPDFSVLYGVYCEWLAHKANLQQ